MTSMMWEEATSIVWVAIGNIVLSAEDHNMRDPVTLVR
jgi:hypothetical protein